MQKHFKAQIDGLTSPIATLFYGVSDSTGYHIKSLAYCSDIGIADSTFDGLEFDDMNGSIPNFK